MTEPSCRSLRELLGVYVVGAIEPADRSLVDSHLSTCHDCREELAGLAALPALLHRVSVPDAERIAGMGAAHVPEVEPSEQMLNALLRQVRARRGSQRVRRLFGLAAAIIIAAGSGVAVTRALIPVPRSGVTFEQAFATNGPLNGWVRYHSAPWGGTAMTVRVTGLSRWTNCKFSVLTTNGRIVRAGGWTVGPASEHIWYPVSVPVPKEQVAAFLITAAHQTLQIPAT